MITASAWRPKNAHGECVVVEMSSRGVCDDQIMPMASAYRLCVLTWSLWQPNNTHNECVEVMCAHSECVATK